MRLDNERPSGNIEDRRGRGGFGFPRRGGMPGGGIRVPIGGRGGIGIGGIVILLIVAFIFGINPLDMLDGGGVRIPGPGTTQSEAPGTGGSTKTTPGSDATKDFVARVLGSTERVWTEQFRTMNRQYDPAGLVLFSDGVESACGMAQSAVGPFYCPQDSKVYIDLSFLEDLDRALDSPGDFAQAYVIAHEVGHHIQNLLGTAEEVTRERLRVPEEEGNLLSVRMELQADCFAGVWARSADETAGILESGDIEEGLNAASKIGDDRMQKRAQGYVVPEAFTHGSSEQRQRWLKRGLETGKITDCDTFATDDL
ncbi:MAG: zinc metallopeptidase [Pseudomonadota bacterium]|nr:zinc metallopeptidase [Pseudomonadota bacterium]